MSNILNLTLQVWRQPGANAAGSPGFPNLTDTDFKVWQIEFDPIEYQQDDTHDARAQPIRVHCAVFTN